MRRPLLCLAFAAAALTLRAEDSAIAVKAARLLDVKTGAYVSNPVVVVRGDHIESVGKSAPPGATLIDLGDRTLLPGLIDAHTHILLQGDATTPEYHEQILQEYPDTKFRSRTILDLANFYQQTSDFTKAATFFERYYQEWEAEQQLRRVPEEDPAPAAAKR